MGNIDAGAKLLQEGTGVTPGQDSGASKGRGTAANRALALNEACLASTPVEEATPVEAAPELAMTSKNPLPRQLSCSSSDECET